MFPNSPELDKMMEMISVNDYASVEDYTFELLNQVGEENLMIEAWVNDGRRMAIRFGLSVLYSDPSTVVNMDDIGSWLGRASEFIDFLLYAETNYGIEGWTNLFNSVAEKHYIDNVLDFALMDFFNDMILTPSVATPLPEDLSLNDFLDNDNMFAVMDIPDIEQAWNNMVNSGEMFGKDFENAWE